MGIVCKGVCDRYRATKPRDGGRYAAGQKRCNSCEIFIHWDGLFCPCCNHRLRAGPRNAKNKEMFLRISSKKGYL